MLKVDPENFLLLSNSHLIIDVRSPSEYQQGHIPGALNIPLFSDEERKEVGILYKTTGRDPSVLRGLEIVGPKLAGFVKTVKKESDNKEILIHCWRGGMRSSSMAWLMDTAGYKTYLLEGGYQNYRRFIRSELEKKLYLIVLGGKTGSGKSHILKSIQKNGEQIIDLEKIANHKGSAFGALGQDKQPSTEHFENILFKELQNLNLIKPVWVEDESRAIGNISLPEPFYKHLRNSPLIFIDIPKEIRIKRLVKEYAGFEFSEMRDATFRIQKRLGGLNTRLVIDALEKKDFETAASILLTYYDKAYLKGMSMRDDQNVFKLLLENGLSNKNALTIINFYKNQLVRKKVHNNIK